MCALVESALWVVVLFGFLGLTVATTVGALIAFKVADWLDL